MKNFKLFLLALGLFSMTAVFTACDDNDSAEEQVEEAGESIADAFRSEREEVEADLRDVREDIDEKLEELREDLDDASDEAKADINAQIAKLEAWGQRVDQDLKRVGDSVENGWENLKGNVRNSLKEIEREWDETFNS